MLPLAWTFLSSATFLRIFLSGVPKEIQHDTTEGMMMRRFFCFLPIYSGFRWEIERWC